jgi:CBS domain-containing protein
LLKVKDVMVKDVVSIQSDQTVLNAVNLMNENKIGCLVVLENGIVVGIVTERDMMERVVAVSAEPAKTFVRQVMSKPVVTVEPETLLEEAVELMFEHRIKKLPVVERSDTDARLVGLVTLTDIARIHPALMKTMRKLFEDRSETPPRQMEKVMNFYIV